jgi:hypothetical protein
MKHRENKSLSNLSNQSNYILSIHYSTIPRAYRKTLVQGGRVDMVSNIMELSLKKGGHKNPTKRSG